MNTPQEEYTRSGLIVKIIRDEDPTNPRDDDNVGTMVCFHNRYILGDKKHGYRMQDYNGWAELKAGIEEGSGPLAAILPIYMYDHSGLTVQTTPFSCPWDSGQIGYIFVTEAKMKEEGIDPGKAEDYLKGEVETYDQYLRGDIYGYTIETVQGETLDSCWGHSGISSAKEAIEDFFKARDAA